MALPALNIQDYLVQAGVNTSFERRSPAVRQNAGFGSVLSSALQNRTENSTEPKPVSGSDIADYLANPIAARHYHRSASVETPQTSVEEPAPLVMAHEKSADPDALNVLAKAPEPVAEAPRQAAATRRQASRTSEIEDSITRAAAQYDLPEHLIRAIIQAESSFRVHAVSPAGAQGLMQLMPQTARELGVTDPFDVAQNIDGGARYFRRMLDMFDNDLKQALAAYNAGPGAVKRFNGDVPYRETQNYIARVMTRLEQLQQDT